MRKGLRVGAGAVALLTAACGTIWYLQDGEVEHSSLPEVGVLAEEGILLHENFDAPQINRELWNLQVTGAGFDTTNKETQAYVDAPEVARIQGGVEGADGGVLVIQAQHTPEYRAPDGKEYDFQSARLTTQDNFEYKYGTATARIQIHGTLGAWPAFWQLGADVSEVSWPASGEVDIMESVGDATWVTSAVHGPGYAGRTPFKASVPVMGGVGAWHEYSVTWSPDELVFYVDGRETHRLVQDEALGEGDWVFGKPQFLLLNLAIGGRYPAKMNGVKGENLGVPEEAVNEITAGNVKMLVDWVKVTR